MCLFCFRRLMKFLVIMEVGFIMVLFKLIFVVLVGEVIRFNFCRLFFWYFFIRGEILCWNLLDFGGLYSLVFKLFRFMKCFFFKKFWLIICLVFWSFGLFLFLFLKNLFMSDEFLWCSFLVVGFWLFRCRYFLKFMDLICVIRKNMILI